MKIGNYTRAVYEYALSARMTKNELRALLAIGDLMWMGIDEAQHSLMLDRRTVLTSLRGLKDAGYIKVARAANAPKGICRKYSVTQKGRELIRNFLNTLNN